MKINIEYKSRKAIAVICVLAVAAGCLTGCSKTAGKGKMAYTPLDPPHHTVAEEIIAAHENYVSTPIQTTIIDWVKDRFYEDFFE